jgi:hypothetical protein
MSMPELKRGGPERAGRSNRGGGWLDGACAAVSVAGLSGDDPVRIIVGDSTSESPFRMGTTAVVTIQGYRGADGSQE